MDQIQIGKGALRVNRLMSRRHAELAHAVRFLSADAVQKAKSGHPGMAMGFADVATVLFTQFLKFDASKPDWPDRDRFILSAGHGSMLLYSVLHLCGVPEIDVDQLRQFRQLRSKTAGHPEYEPEIGIETTTGPLGQGLANGVGMALAERLLNRRFGDSICDHYTYVLAGDGCLMEGISQEALSLAGHLRLGKLIVLFDDNKVSIDGPTDLTESDDQLARFAASRWHVQECDGHDPLAIAEAISKARAEKDRPSLISFRTVIGFGAPNLQGTAECHGAPLGPEEIALAREELDWPYEPFEVPDHILREWRAAGSRLTGKRLAWETAFDALPEEDRGRLFDPLDETASAAMRSAISELKSEIVDEAPKQATRFMSQEVLERLLPLVPGLIGGSADLSDSNGTVTSQHRPISPGDFAGNYLYYGVREHAMAGIMNGMALHGGVIPYGGSFLVFMDYCRPSLRLAALMRQRMIYVMSHDSIGVGEDGPTHQPIEHLSSLRAIPNFYVMRPADGVEVAECWELALTATETPSVLSLTRQGVPTVRTTASEENLSAQGAYVLQDCDGARDATILATGSEVTIAIGAADRLAEEGLNVAVVSMPCWELFEKQDRDYQDQVLGSAPRVAIEAGVRYGWDRWIGRDGTFVGMEGFGKSAPGPQLYEHFGLTVDKLCQSVRNLLPRS